MPEQYFIIISTIIALVSLSLYIVERIRNQRLQEKINKPAIELASGKATEIISQASIRAQAILGKAVQTEMKLQEVQAVEAEKLQKAMEEHFNAALKEYGNFLDQTREKAGQALTQKTQSVFDRFEQNLSDFLIQTQQKSTYTVDLEMQAARNLIDTYKRSQLNLIDEHIIAVLERTLSLVLAKKLSLSDQVDLINEALEKAKTEKFII